MTAVRHEKLTLVLLGLVDGFMSLVDTKPSDWLKDLLSECSRCFHEEYGLPVCFLHESQQITDLLYSICIPRCEHSTWLLFGRWHNLVVNIQNISPLVIKFLLLWMSLIVLHWTGLVTFSSLIGVNIVAWALSSSLSNALLPFMRTVAARFLMASY